MPRYGLYSEIPGREGSVRIEALGVLVGSFESWKLRRRGSDRPGEGLYDLLAVFSYVNEHLWNDPEYEKVVTVTMSSMGQRRVHRIEQQPGFATHLDGGRVFRMEGVILCPVE